MNQSQKAIVSRFNPKTEEIETVNELSVWACRPNPDFDDADFDGICIAGDDGNDITISTEALAAMGYVKQ